MKAVRTEHTNSVFTKEGCFDLPGTSYRYDDGTPGIETCWELSDEEIEQITKDRKVFVYMQGNTVPPMFLSVKSELKFEGGDNDEQ